jgi:hypothetical protein
MQKFLSVCFLLFSTLLVIGCGNKINKSHLFAEPGISMHAYLEPEIQTKMDEVLQGSSGAIYLLGLLRLSGDSKYLDGYGTSVAGSLPIPLPLPKIPIGVDIGAVKSAAAYNAIKGSGIGYGTSVAGSLPIPLPLIALYAAADLTAPISTPIGILGNGSGIGKDPATDVP